MRQMELQNWLLGGGNSATLVVLKPGRNQMAKNAELSGLIAASCYHRIYQPADFSLDVLPHVWFKLANLLKSLKSMQLL